MNTLSWTGPFMVRALLDGCLDDDHSWPPASHGVYVVSDDAWSSAPRPACRPLYFGGNTGKSQRFCTRIGDLIADVHGFWDGGTGHHSGGQSLYAWCKANSVLPGNLFLGWATTTPWCDRCAENHVANLLAPSWEQRGELLNKVRPTKCGVHAPASR